MVQAAVWSLFVAVLAPDRDLPSGVKQVLNPTDPKAHFSVQLPVPVVLRPGVRGEESAQVALRDGGEDGLYRTGPTLGERLL